MIDSTLNFANVSELGRLLRKKAVSSVELTRLFLDRLAAIGPRFNAVAELTPELAMVQSRRADKLIARGEIASPLLGIPYGAKDLLATKGVPTRWGAPPYRDQVFDYDATVIRRLQVAGAVLAAKLSMVELAGGGGYAHASASVNGAGLNPWNVKHWSGGSSSGSGSAVAAGLVPFALGSETWGSIITPSAYCGITGLRPTWGWVSRFGAMELAWSMDKVGPMARTAEDCGWILQAIAGYDARDWTTVPAGFQFTRRMPAAGLRLGILPGDFTGEPEIERAFEAALRVFRSAGMKTKRARLPEHPYLETTRILLSGEAAAAHKELIESPRLDELVDDAQKEGLRKNLQITAAAYVRASKRREEITSQVLDIFESFDVLLTPSLMSEAVPISTNLQNRRRRRGGYGELGALCGLPALTMPMGFGRRGLPLGLSLIGNLYSENVLLQLGMLFQRETDWHLCHPPVSAPDEVD